jgi:CO/xanthine dehydrogenase Mo-binding subunit
VVNPIGLKGQIHGGVVQGLGQALFSSRRAGVLAAKTSPISDVQT